MYLGNYGLRKRWLEKCLKSPLTDEPSTSNMVNGSKYFWILDDGIFPIFIDHCEHNSVGKNLKTVC